MNLPNKLTIGRMAIVPILWLVYGIEKSFGFEYISLFNAIMLVLVIIGSLLDFLDGNIARKTNQVTTFGKFLDPIADKLLVVSMFIILYDQAVSYNSYLILQNGKEYTTPDVIIDWWVLAIVIAREFIVSGVRLVAAEKSSVIAASYFGKAKTVSQFILIIYLVCGFMLNGCSNFAFSLIAKIMLIIMAAATIFSGYDYVVKNFDIIKEGLFINKKRENKK